MCTVTPFYTGLKMNKASCCFGLSVIIRSLVLPFLVFAEFLLLLLNTTQGSIYCENMDRGRIYRADRSAPRAIGGDNDGFPIFRYPPGEDGSNHLHHHHDSNNNNNMSEQPRPTPDRQCYTWSKIPNLNGQVPPPRSGAASVVTRHPQTGAARLWVLAGYGGNVSRLDDFYYYDFNTGLWEMVHVLSPEKPGPRENNGVVLSDSTSQSIYLFGGVSAYRSSIERSRKETLSC